MIGWIGADAVQETVKLRRSRAARPTILAALAAPANLLVLALLFGKPEQARALTTVVERPRAGSA
jgi:hypothetical protein